MNDALRDGPLHRSDRDDDSQAPRQVASEVLYVRITPAMKRSIEIAAKSDERTVSDWLRRLVRRAVERRF